MLVSSVVDRHVKTQDDGGSFRAGNFARPVFDPDISAWRSTSLCPHCA